MGVKFPCLLRLEPIRITSQREKLPDHEQNGMHSDYMCQPAKLTAQTRGMRLHEAAVPTRRSCRATPPTRKKCRTEAETPI
jgi:hypothetical protein